MSKNIPRKLYTHSPNEHQFQLDFDLELESGELLHHPILAYQTWGKLNTEKSNIIWVCHALTGNHRVHEWWNGLFGEGKCFDPVDYFIVSVNVLGSCYGSTGPLSFTEKQGRYFRDFPQVTVRDMVKGLEYVRLFLGIEHIHILIGGSLGGQQVIEWAIQQPDLFSTIIPIATNIQHSPFGIAFNESQRLAIEADTTFEANEYNGGQKGLIAARAIAMLSYRTYRVYEITQSEENSNKQDDYKASSYQRYQGEKLSHRFNSYSYWFLSKAMDSHNIARNRKQANELLKTLKMNVLVIGIDSDILFPIHEQRYIGECIPNSHFATLQSDFGHDGFLVEYEQLTKIINDFLIGDL